MAFGGLVCVCRICFDECLRAVFYKGFYLHLSVFGYGNRLFCLPGKINIFPGGPKGKRREFMLQIKDLTITHKYDLRVILEDFNFVLNPGDKAVIIGEEGNGKSTLLKWIYQPELVEDYVEVEGERVCTGERLGYLPQELPEEDREKSIYEFLCEEEMFWETDPRELSQMASRLHVPVEFFYGEQKMGTLSGGEKIKIQMVRLLIGQPTMLLLDEPSNDIDIDTLEWLEKLIRETTQAVLFISHDETLIERTANRVVHLEQLCRKMKSRYTVANMTYDEYLKSRKLNFENQKRKAENDRREEDKRQEKLRKIMQKVHNEQNSVSRQDPHGGYLLKKKMRAVKSMEKRFERESEDMTEIPEEENAIFFRLSQESVIPSGKTVLKYDEEYLKTQDLRILSENVHLWVKGPEKVCIIGKNGVGKTTLLKQIASELLERDDIRAAYMPQNYEDLLELDKTPVEYLAQVGDKEETTKIRTYLGSLKYTTDEMNHGMAELSGGQKAKVLLLKMSLSGANVLILDEPTRNFSPLSNPVIRKILSEYPGAIISISHDRKYIREVCDTVYELTEKGFVRKNSF